MNRSIAGTQQNSQLIIMCGRLNIEDPQKLSNLLSEFDWPVDPGAFYPGRFKRATDTIAVLRQTEQGVSLQPAIWWLLLEPDESGFKASKYTSFNSRYDKLNKPRSAGYSAYRNSRCLIPVNGFGETEFINKKPQRYTDLVGHSKPLLLGGLCRQWRHPKSAEIVQSCSVITVPPHPRLRHIHSKSMPLIMSYDKELLQQWLDPKQQRVELFDSLLTAAIPEQLIATQIDKPSSFQAVSEPEFISSD